MKKPTPKSKAQRETNPSVLRSALLRRFDRRITGEGEVEFPCIPAMIDSYMAKLTSLWSVIGRPFSEEELAHLRSALEGELERGYRGSVYSRLSVRFVTYKPPHPGIEYFITPKILPLQEVYAGWLSGKDGPLFGRLPDAKIIALTTQLGDRSLAPVIDIGAGDGRNALAVARLGHPTCAVEPVRAMAEKIRTAAVAETLALEVIQGDVLAPDLPLKKGHYKLAVVADVTAHFRDVDDMRRLYGKLAEILVPGGLALVSSFFTSEGYKPDDILRQAAQSAWSTVFSRAELAFITQELPFDKISDESVYQYEKEHLPAGGWPPTEWFEAWTQAGDVFDLPAGKAPMDNRWVVHRRR
jgi:SAM-dependent methyltransferase